MIEYQEEDREKAIKTVLYVLRNQLHLASIPDQEVALRLSQFHEITAIDLIETATRRIYG